MSGPRGLPLVAGLLWVAPVLHSFAGSPAPWGDLVRPAGIAFAIGALGTGLGGRVLGNPLAGAVMLTLGALAFWELEWALRLLGPVPGPLLVLGLVALGVAAFLGLPRLGGALAGHPRVSRGLTRGLTGLALVFTGLWVTRLVGRAPPEPPSQEDWRPVPRLTEDAPDLIAVILEGLRPGDLRALDGQAEDEAETWPSTTQSLRAMCVGGRLAAWFGVAGYRTRLVRGGPVSLRGRGFEEVVEGGLERLEHRLVARSALGLLRLDLQVSSHRTQLERALRALPAAPDPADPRPRFTVLHLLAPAPPYVMPADGGTPDESLLTVWDLGEVPAGDARDARERQVGWLVRELDALRGRVAARERPTRLVLAGDRPGLRRRLVVPAP